MDDAKSQTTRILPKVTRLEIIDQSGRIFVDCGMSDVKTDLQDEGRTLKIFCKREGSTDD